MLFRTLAPDRCDELSPAYKAFLKAQNAAVPCGLIRQLEHSKLAGALAGAMLPEAFGTLSRDVIAATADHDFGWTASDNRQFETLDRHAPRSFTQVSAEDTLPCWIGSIAHGRELGPLAAVLISRHCCLLGTGSGKHAEFVACEAAQRCAIEAALPYQPSDLDRWTAALGFCDLLSLYLCSGSETPVSIPVAHPENKNGARHVTLRWSGGSPCLSEPLIPPGAHFSADAVQYSGPGRKLEALSLEWTFGGG